MKKVLILDLDNTIYPVSSIAERLFSSLFKIITNSGEFNGNIEEIKLEIMRRPFQFVAKDYSFSEKLLTTCLELLYDSEYDMPIEPFEDFNAVREIRCKKHLVTSGFTKMQYSKIRHLNVENDFDSIFVVDPAKSDLTKKDIFRKILIDNRYNTNEILIVGDDLNSEIKAGRELGIDTILYDYKHQYSEINNQLVIHDFNDLKSYF